jgi:hypothetical protein
MKTPKLGRQFNYKLNYDEVNIECHTINCINFKSVYFLIEGWFDLDDRGLNKLKTNMGRTIQRHLDKSMFITDKLISYSEFPRTLSDGFGFSMFEYTVYLKHTNIVNVEQAKEPIRRVIEKIYDENFVDVDFRVKKLRKAKKRRWTKKLL